MSTWQEVNEVLTKKTASIAVTVYTSLLGVLTLENTEHVTTLLGWGSLTVGIIVGVMTIRNLRIKTALLKSQLEAHTQERAHAASLRKSNTEESQ